MLYLLYQNLKSVLRRTFPKYHPGTQREFSEHGAAAGLHTQAGLATSAAQCPARGGGKDPDGATGPPSLSLTRGNIFVSLSQFLNLPRSGRPRDPALCTTWPRQPIKASAGSPSDGWPHGSNEAQVSDTGMRVSGTTDVSSAHVGFSVIDCPHGVESEPP